MQLDEVCSLIETEQPRLIHISGKTSTGKSTFAQKLHDELDYVVVELDKVFVHEVMPQFGLTDRATSFVHVYKLREHPDVIAAFVQAVHRAIDQELAVGRRVIVDGAVAHPETLHDLFGGYDDFMFVYLHPGRLDTYVRNLTSRFITSNEHDEAGLPQHFWQLMGDGLAADFWKTHQLTPDMKSAIRKYAEASQAQSKERLTTLRARFPHLTLVTI